LLTLQLSGVAVGSSIGHAIGGFFGGGSSQAEQAPAAEAQTNANAYGDNYSNSNSSVGMANCEPDARAFTRCLDENKGEYQMSVCGWYLEQLVSFATSLRTDTVGLDLTSVPTAESVSVGCQAVLDVRQGGRSELER